MPRQNGRRPEAPFSTRSISAYLRVGSLLHLITLMEIAILTLAAHVLTVSETESWPVAALNCIILSVLAALPALSQLDARSRFQSYKRVKTQMLRFGFDTRILKPLLKSRCQRDAAWVAADELGYGSECRHYYRLQGYRWYHLLPDFILTNPRFLLTRHFWQATFFMETYRPKAGSRSQKKNTAGNAVT